MEKLLMQHPFFIFSLIQRHSPAVNRHGDMVSFTVMMPTKIYLLHYLLAVFLEARLTEVLPFTLYKF